MFDKPDTSAADFFALPDLALVTLTGVDAGRFAQAQFMNDVAALPIGHWHWNGWLTAKGRVVALFALTKHTEDKLVLLLPDVDPEGFCAALGQFVFRSKVKISPAPGRSITGCFSAPKQARASAVAELDNRVLELDFSAEGGARTLLLSAVDGFPVCQTSLPAAPPVNRRGADLWCSFDLAHGLPRLLPGQAGHWTPQHLSLDRLNAYSVKKGCYPGQEIVARTHFLGQSKRGLVRLVADHAIEPETGVQVDETPATPLVACAGHEALAVLALDTAPDACIRIGGHPVKRQPLLGGLGRQAG